MRIVNICFDTFGCRLNRAESLNEEARCIARGDTIVTSHSDADVIVVRGCSVTQRAQHECEKLIQHLRLTYPTKRIITTGCLPGAKPFTISSVHARRAQTSDPLPTRTARAYLKVQDGCSCACSFCIVPTFRGPPVSISFTEILDRAKRMIDAGYREIVVTGCNLCLYVSNGHRLADLATALAHLSPDCRIRLGSIEPGTVAQDLVAAMSETPNICRFLHLSVQSGSDRILTAMRRPYHVQDVELLAEEATRRLPRLGLGCDLIAGFPDETEMDFQQTKRLLLRYPFSNVHAFAYSERPGTLAAGLPGKIPIDQRRARAHALSTIAAENRHRFLQKFIGRTVDIIVERNSRLAGWTSEYVWFEESDKPHSPSVQSLSHRKERLTFKVLAAHDGKLFGERVHHGR